MPVVTPRFDLDPDTTLGGANASDEVGATQKAVKDYVDNRPGLTVDQTYNGSSTNAQSGTAVAGAISTKANDSDVGKLASNNTWTGNNSIKNTTPFLRLQSSDIDKGTAPSSDRFGYLSWYDKNGTTTANRLGNLEFCYQADGGTRAKLFSYKPQSGSTTQASVGVYYPASGSPYATAPAPTEDTTSSIQIDTVGARNTKLQSYALDSNVVKTSGIQTIADTKKFTSALVYKNTSMTAGTPPASDTTSSGFQYRDNADKNLGLIQYTYKSDGGGNLQFRAYNPANLSQYANIRLGYDSGGHSYTEAPTPTEDTTSSTQIDTVGARNTKLANYGALASDNTWTGDNTFSKIIKLSLDGTKIVNSGVTKGTTPSTNQTSTFVVFNDSSDSSTWANTRTGQIDHIVRNNGRIETRLISYLNTAGSTSNGYISAITDTTTSKRYASCNASDVVNSIVTTTGISKSGDGYVKLGNGIIIQWGNANAGSTTTVTLPTAFTGTNYRAVCTNQSDNGYVYAPSITNLTTTGFKIHSYGSASSNKNWWIAIGY